MFTDLFSYIWLSREVMSHSECSVAMCSSRKKCKWGELVLQRHPGLQIVSQIWEGSSGNYLYLYLSDILLGENGIYGAVAVIPTKITMSVEFNHTILPQSSWMCACMYDAAVNTMWCHVLCHVTTLSPRKTSLRGWLNVLYLMFMVENTPKQMSEYHQQSQ